MPISRYFVFLNYIKFPQNSGIGIVGEERLELIIKLTDQQIVKNQKLLPVVTMKSDTYVLNSH